MTTPSATDFLAYAALMNGRCDKCNRILPHKDSGKTHECNEKEKK